MKKTKITLITIVSTLIVLSACKKEITDLTERPTPVPTTPNKPDTVAGKGDSITVKLKAIIRIGEVVYDSLPGIATIISWDSSGKTYENTLNLKPGANTVKLLKAHVKHQFKLSKWDISDELTYTREQLDEGVTIGLGGSKAAKKLRLEERFIFAEGAYRPEAKSVYSYNSNGTLKTIEYYQKKPDESNLVLYNISQYVYQNGTLKQIKLFDAQGEQVGFTSFTYNAQDKIVNIHQDSYGQETFAAVNYAYSTGQGNITIDYLFDNGKTMEYLMTFKGGNKTEDKATSSRGGGEGGTYTYDFNINPYRHIEMPNLFLSNMPKNNLTGQQKQYSGGFPTAEPYKFEYSYDTEGYPKEVIKSYKSYQSGEHLYNAKTIFTY